MKKIYILFFVLMLLACSTKDENMTIAPQETPYVILPANFIIDLAADSTVQLNPGVQDFIIYPGSQEAKTAFTKARLNRDEWRVYRVEGDFAEITRTCGPNLYCLTIPSRIVDWEQL